MLKRYVFAAIVPCLLAQCASAEKKEKPTIVGAAQVQDSRAEFGALKKDLQKNYGRYTSISANFVVKGKVDGRQVYYSGALKSYSSDVQNPNLHITVKEPTFDSPLAELRVKGDSVTERNYIRDSTIRRKLESYRWVELFGRVFPFRFFLPILMGGVPQEVYLQNASYQPGKSRIMVEAGQYEFIVNLTGSTMKNIYYKSKMANEGVLIMQFIGRVKNKLNLIFPQKIIITQSRSDDYLTMNFSRVRIR